MSRYWIEPERHTLHGHWSRELSPVLTIDSGETVIFRTLEAGWAIEPRTSTVWSQEPKRFPNRHPHLDSGHALCGPVAIRGAEPGMTLAVHFDEIRPDHWGWTVALLERSDESMEEICLLWQIDPDNGTATTQQGHTVRIQPFMGVSGLAPAEPGQHATRPPRTVGGNMDCKELVAGSTLYLPVAVAGGLFSTGDGHALQGDGEVSGTAIECPMERVQITFTLLPEVTIETPYAETPTGFLTMGFSPDLNIATEIALHAMLDHLENRLRVSRVEALALASVLVDLRVTQIVNAVHGVHAFFPKDSLINL